MLVDYAMLLEGTASYGGPRCRDYYIVLGVSASGADTLDSRLSTPDPTLDVLGASAAGCTITTVQRTFVIQSEAYGTYTDYPQHALMASARPALVRSVFYTSLCEPAARLPREVFQDVVSRGGPPHFITGTLFDRPCRQY